MIMLSSGLAYTFSIYSENLKERFNYTQTEIAGVGTACNIGGYLAIFAGLFYDSLRRWNRSVSAILLRQVLSSSTIEIKCRKSARDGQQCMHDDYLHQMHAAL